MSTAPTVVPATDFGPVPSQERIETLDILRGFALFCILVVNWSVDFLWDVEPWAGWKDPANQIAYWTVEFLLNEKSWPIFAFLFGLGFSIQMQRAEARGARFVRVYARRLAVLFLIGAAHFILTDRDILYMYAIFGLLLLPLRKVNLNLLVVLALICILIPWTRNTLIARDRELRLANPQTGQQAAQEESRRQAANRARGAQMDRTYESGTFGQIVSMRARLFWRRISSWTSYLSWLGDPFPPFLLGLYAGRRRIFHEVAAHRHFVRKAMWWSMALGLAGTAIFTVVAEVALLHGESVPYPTLQLARLAEQLGSPTLGVGYIATLTLLLHREAWKKRLAPLAAVGRMALTNYLLQSVAFVLLFFGYGLGLYGKVGAFGGLMLALPVFAVEVVASQWWLRRFRFGPAEWLWRSLTYGSLQPMRIGQPLAAAGVP